mgnify:CR=1 FL=1
MKILLSNDDGYRAEGLRALDVEAARLTAEAIGDAASAAGVPIQTDHLGAMFGFFLTDEPVTDYTSAARSDRAAFARLHRLLLDRGVYLPPSPFEACFTSSAHTLSVVEEAAAAFRTAFALL